LIRVRVLACLFLFACAPGGDGGDDAPPPSELDHLPPAAMPFALWNDTGFPDGGGIYIGQGMYYQTRGGPVWERAAVPAAVAALPDRVAVVFAPADHPGLDLAFAGADLPWTRQPLTELPRSELGALDAIAGLDHTLYIAVRERLSGTIHLYHWHDGTIDHEVVPRPEAHRHATWRERCPDIVMGMSRAGDLDLLMLQADPTYRLVRMRKHAGQWTTDEVATAATTTPPSGFFVEFGCRSRIAYDEDDTPMVLTMTRLIANGTPEIVGGSRDPSSPLPVGVLSPAPQVSFAGYFVGGDARWRLASTSTDRARSTGPFAVLDPFSDGSAGEFDLETRPDGLVVSGPDVSLHSIDSDHGAELWLPVSQVARTAPPAVVYDQTYPVHQIDFDDAAAFISEVDKITFDRCGNLQAYGGDRLSVMLETPLMQKGFHACLTPHHAPVRGGDIYGFAPVWAHGPRAYDVQLCLARQLDTTLSICVGGWPDNADLQYVADASLPHVVSASADGTVVLDRAVADGERVEARAMAMGAADDVPTEITGPHEPTIHAMLPALAPGAAYRLLVTAGRGDTIAADFANVRVDYDFRVPDPGYVDPRYTPRDPVCQGTRDGSGACVLAVRPDPAAGHGVALPLDVDPAYPTVPALHDLAGTVIPSHQLVWDVDLAPGTTYVASYPPGTVDRLGAAYTDGQRTLIFTTAAP